MKLNLKFYIIFKWFKLIQCHQTGPKAKYFKLYVQETELQELLTHEVSLDELNEAFEMTKQPDYVKVLIKF